MTTVGSSTVGVSASLTTTPGASTTASVGTYSSNPVGALPNGVSFYEVRVTSAGGITQIVVTFYYPSSVTNPNLLWWNPGTNQWVPVCCNPTINTAAHTITLTLSASSSPTISQLTATQFGVTSSSIVPEYPLGLPFMAILMLLCYMIIRRTRTAKRVKSKLIIRCLIHICGQL